MILREDGGFETKENSDEESKQPLGEDNEDMEYPITRDLLVNKRALSVQVKEEDNEAMQYDNIFHTRCHTGDKMCSVVIDRGSFMNVSSIELVEKLSLPTMKHPRSYKLQWLNNCGEVKVNKQVLVAFSIGKYMDKFLCDFVPMHVSHLLLGRPWQYDKKVQHDGF